MSKRLTLQASGNSYFQGYECEHCGSAQVIASESKTPYCAFCQASLNKGTPVSRAELTASPEKELSYIKCVSCDTVFAVEGADETAEETAASKYCVDCAGDSLVACDSTGAVLESSDDTQEESKDGELSDNADEDVKDALEDGIVTDSEATDSEESKDDTYSELDASTHDDLQWSALDTTEGEQTAMIASSKKTGNPIALFRKAASPTAMQPLFAQSLFVSAFNEVAGNDGLATAIKAFGGSYFSEKVLTASDIEKAALANMETTAIPRLIDCCQMAVEGGVKGIYPDVYNSLQRSMVNELVASGVDVERANNAVANTFATHGSDLFGTIVAKAMDLFVKPEASRLEAKALIMQASGAAPVNTKQAQIRAAMEKPVLDFGVLSKGHPLTASAKNPDIANLRRELF